MYSKYRNSHLLPVLLVIMMSTMVLAPATGAQPGDAQRGSSIASSAAVPPEYADLYVFLREKIAGIDSHVGTRWKGETHEVTFAAELLAANGNQGENLFRPQNWDAVLLNLDRLQTLGARGVKVGLKYPLLVPGFPRSAEYLAYFKRVGDEVRRRNLRLLVQITTAFTEPTFSTVPVTGYYAGLTFERYKREKRQMVETIIRDIRPTYLTVENEPTTQSQNTRLRFTVQSVADIMEFVLRGLDKQGVLIGAGAGTWEDAAYISRMAAIGGIDYIDLHLYPLNRDYADKVFKMAEIARAGNKRIVIGEAWLYKARDAELTRANVANAPALFARDVFSFWEPLDVEFLATAGRLAHYLKVDFISFFWSRHFYGYLEYTDATRTQPPAALFRLVNRTAAGNMLADPPRPTQTGLQFQKLAKTSD